MNKWRKYWEDIGNSNLDDNSASHLSKITSDEEIQIIRKQRFEKIIFDRSYNLLLDAGCGVGDSFVKFINKCNKTIGLDFALPMLLRAKKRFNKITLINGDALSLPFKNNTFDIYRCHSLFYTK